MFKLMLYFKGKIQSIYCILNVLHLTWEGMYVMWFKIMVMGCIMYTLYNLLHTAVGNKRVFGRDQYLEFKLSDLTFIFGHNLYVMARMRYVE